MNMYEQLADYFRQKGYEERDVPALVGATSKAVGLVFAKARLEAEAQRQKEAAIERDYCPIPCVRSHGPDDFCYHKGATNASDT